jgi:hypothetical protein
MQNILDSIKFPSQLVIEYIEQVNYANQIPSFYLVRKVISGLPNITKYTKISNLMEMEGII